MGRYLGDFCGAVNGHTFIHECMFLPENGAPSDYLVRAIAHAKRCEDCRSGIAVSLREHSRSNPAFDHARFYGTMARLEQEADKL